jgi:hypothetical protein
MQDELEVITGQLGNDPDLAHYGAERVLLAAPQAGMSFRAHRQPR